ncbi:MAG: divalent metal cation transporter, partial [Myxococcota bacterium]
QRRAGVEDSRAVYWIALLILAVGATLIIANIARLDFRLLIDIATALAFLTAPALAVLNHRAVTGAEVPEDRRPSPAMICFSWLSIITLAAVALWWIVVRFG